MKHSCNLTSILSLLTLLASQCPADTSPLPVPLESLNLTTHADPRTRTYILPTRVLWHTDAPNARVENPDSLLVDGPGQVTLRAPARCTLRNTGTGRAAILLDFGAELHGGVQILALNNSHRPTPIPNNPMPVRIRFGESAAEAMSDNLYGPQNPTNDHAIRDQITLIPRLGSAEIGNTGFRFVRIDLEEDDAFLELQAVRAVLLLRPLEYQGSFRSNDERLNRIWQTGAYTVHLNMQDYLWDGIKRDRLVWIGDMHPETMTIQCVFGPQNIVPRSLDLIAYNTPYDHWMNGISSYSMWWIVIQHDNYLYTGDKSYLALQRPNLIDLLGRFAQYVGPDGRETLPGRRFLDWPNSNNPPALHAGLHALLILTLEKGAFLCDVLDEPDTRKLCLDAARKLRTYIPDPGDSKSAAALVALARLRDPAQINADVLAVDGPQRMSTFYGYYVLQARALAGDYPGALDAIRQYWGAMLDLGATTFWEDFDLAWIPNASRIDQLPLPGQKDIHGDFGNYCYLGYRHSLCHGWASGPTAWLSQHVLGITPLEPGCRAVRIDPHLADLQWVEGTYPTPQGLISVRHEKQPDGSLRSTIHAPDAIRIVR